jgi:hypothetical protein
MLVIWLYFGALSVGCKVNFPPFGLRPFLTTIGSVVVDSLIFVIYKFIICL